jgi:hypothetical protein
MHANRNSSHPRTTLFAPHSRCLGGLWVRERKTRIDCETDSVALLVMWVWLRQGESNLPPLLDAHHVVNDVAIKLWKHAGQCLDNDRVLLDLDATGLLCFG